VGGLVALEVVAETLDGEDKEFLSKCLSQCCILVQCS
jgi:hypothetical protein